MKRFPIFKPGRHTASSGASIDFSEDTLRAAVAAYDPTLHEAPITVGHPKDNAPAYGWVGAMSFNDATGEIEVDPSQVDADFAEMVQAGRFKKRSASWYMPDAPANPKPGSLYLRHVAFLGAQAPAVKGLRDVNFADSEEGVVEFADSARYAWGSIAAIMRGVREWIIGEKGVEIADKIVPNFYLSDVDAAAKAAIEEPAMIPAGTPVYSEGNAMKLEEAIAKVAELEAQNAALKATQAPADFAERVAGVEAREAAVAKVESELARAGVQTRVEAAVKAGRLVPKQRAAVIDFAMSLNASDLTVDFGEGAAAKKVTQREAYLVQVESAPKVVDYADHGAGASEPGEGAGDPQAIADKARSLVAEAKTAGRDMSFTEAVAKATATTTV